MRRTILHYQAIPERASSGSPKRMIFSDSRSFTVLRRGWITSRAPEVRRPPPKYRRRDEPSPVIGDHEAHLLLLAQQLYADPLGLGVLAHVGKGFLGYAVERDLY